MKESLPSKAESHKNSVDPSGVSIKSFEPVKEILEPVVTDQIADKKKSLSRRALFGLGAGALAAATAAPEKAHADEAGDKMENVVSMETANAKYKIVYSEHPIPVNPEVIEGGDAVILEGLLPENFTIEQFSRDLIASLNKDAISEFAGLKYKYPYRDLLLKAFDENKPVFMADALITKKFLKSDEKMTKELDKKFARESRESTAAPILIGAGTLFFAMSKKSSRRGFLRGISGALGSMGAYFSTQIPEMSRTKSIRSEGVEKLKNRNMNSFSNKFLKIDRDINSTIHPETRTGLIDTRSTLIAEKAEHLAQQLVKNLKRKPSITLVIGSSHTGIERELRSSSEERLLDLKKAIGTDMETEGALIQMQRKGDYINFYRGSDPDFK